MVTIISCTIFSRQPNYPATIMKSPFEKKLITGLAAGVMGAHPVPSDITPYHQLTEQASSGYGKIFDRVGSETKEDKELEEVARYVLEAKKRMKALHLKNMHDQARAELSRAVDHLIQSYPVSAKKYSASLYATVSHHIYDLYLFEGGYCTTREDVTRLYESGIVVSPRLALDAATLHHKDGKEVERIDVLSRGYETALSDPDWHTRFDIGEEYALALGMNGRGAEALKVYKELFSAYQELISRHAIAVDIHVQTIVDEGDFKKVEPYVDEQAFGEYTKYRAESFEPDMGLQK